MAVYTNTELNATVQEKWWQQVDDARYAKAVVLPKVMNVSKDAKFGDIVHLTYESKLSTGNVTQATGAFTAGTTTPTSTAVTINQWQYVAVEITDLSMEQSFYDPLSNFAEKAGAALGEAYDTALLGTYASFTTHTYGTSAAPVVFDDTAMLISMFKLVNADIPKEDLVFILSPEATYRGILTKPEFRDADKTGLPASVLTTNYRYKLLGIPAYESTLVPTADISRPNLLLHPSALAIALQKKGVIKSYDATPTGALKQGKVAQSLYGYNTFRTDHACVIYVRKET